MAVSELLTPEFLDHDKSKYPFCSAFFDPETTNGLRIQELVENAIPFTPSSVVDYFEVTNGRGALFKNLNLDDPKVATQIYAPRDEVFREFRVFFCNQDVSRRIPVALNKLGFLRLLEENAVPPTYIEAFVNNNGSQTSFTTYSEDGHYPESFHCFIKFPTAPALNAAIYLRYDLKSQSTTCLIFGTYTEQLQKRLQQFFHPKNLSSPPSVGKDPFSIFSAIFAEYSSILEYECRRLDLLVREQESKTGMHAHTYDESLRASATQYLTLNKNLHVCESSLMFFERAVEYQVSCIEFLRAQHTALTALRNSSNEHKFLKMAQTLRVDRSTNNVRDSLSLTASFSCNRLIQVQTLNKRIQIQLTVVRDLVSQNDSRTNIAVALESSKIAVSAKDDSEVMKTIAILTMLFLPGTFISTLFAMPFFHVGNEDDVKLVVDNHIWLYVAVTVPLTALVFVLWGAWSRTRVQGKKGDMMKHEDTGKTSSIAMQPEEA